MLVWSLGYPQAIHNRLYVNAYHLNQWLLHIGLAGLNVHLDTQSFRAMRCPITLCDKF